MKIAFGTLALVTGMAFSVPAFAADKAACLSNWAKLDTTNAGFITGASATESMAMMKKANKPTAAADRMTSQEYMTACEAGIFEMK